MISSVPVRMLATAILCAAGLSSAAPAETADHEARAVEVMESIQKNFWDRKSGLYASKSGCKEPEMIWGGGVMFSAVVGATRHDKGYRMVMRKFFDGLEAYWDLKAEIPGYEPARTQGGHDKYYDDNAWMVLTFLEAYEVTGESRYLKRAEETLEFVVSGWDDKAGGGIWWHEQHKGDCKNTCVNAPAALGCFRLARHLKEPAAKRWNDMGEKIAVWTVKTLQAPNGLFSDAIKVGNGEVNRAQLTYNAGLMLRVFLSLHARTGERFYLDEAIRMGKAADGLLDSKTRVYRDPPKWTHLMVEADLELYRATRDDHFLQRAIRTTDAHYAAWKKAPAPALITQASLARELWLLVDHRTPAGREFWKAADKMPAQARR
ncbi:glycoside hydrolase family 76 protein [Luteolibacter marinus]|uniref:glycoside hydrolase family 76 protein n=1 Tax=Luteolibacter marinus TaxID=2776705 RepID=UPI001868C431|nr:glycoside hydrolase family 76 protein [Luteolibacter marinus]